jgi:DNA-binding PadR family transcriptional regulator
MSTAQALLGLLEHQPAHGYTLKRQYDDLFARARPLAFGQVYAALARFERNGWAEVAAVEAGGGPERKLYRITTEGVSLVDEFVFQPEPSEAAAASTLFIRVSLALMSGRDAALVLDQQREHHLARMRELTAARRSANAAEMLTATYELAHLDADLRWIEEAGQRLDAMREAVRR